MIFKKTANALKGQNHQRRATPCDWRTETFQALKGRKPIQRLLSPFDIRRAQPFRLSVQGLECYGSPITGRCPVLMILPLQGIGCCFENHYRLFIFHL